MMHLRLSIHSLQLESQLKKINTSTCHLYAPPVKGNEQQGLFTINLPLHCSFSLQTLFKIEIHFGSCWQ